MVFDGTRNLTPNSIRKFAKALKFDKRQTDYFEALVLFNQAKNDKDRETYLDRLNRLKPKVKLTGLQKEQYDFFKKWHYVIIREMVALPNFQEDEDWIASHISPPIKPKETREALDALIKLKLLTRDEKGNLHQSESSLSTSPSVASLDLFYLYLDMIKLAKESLLRVSSDLRDFSSLTIPIPLKTLDEVKTRIREFRQELLAIVNQAEPDYHEVFQMNFQVFPVTTANKKTDTIT